MQSQLSKPGLQHTCGHRAQDIRHAFADALRFTIYALSGVLVVSPDQRSVVAGRGDLSLATTHGILSSQPAMERRIA
jgi:hypothetical protein